MKVLLKKEKMKNTVFLALMIIAAFPASAQKAASPNCSVNSETVNSETMTALAAEYAARVDGLLRDAHASLQNISEDAEAGNLTSEEAQKLKLAVTRNMISRLDAISAVYDVRLNDANKTSRAALNASGTVSVEELKRETAAALVTKHTEQVPR